jgi:fluoride exporter
MLYNLPSFLLVFIGGGIGSVLRYIISLNLVNLQQKLPWATLVSNGLACLILGFLVGLQMEGNLSDSKKLLFATGLCGGFSTFSTFTAETWQIMQTGDFLQAMLNVIGSLVLCFFCFYIGLKIDNFL